MRVIAKEAKEKLCPMIQRNCVGESCMMWEEAEEEFRFQGEAGDFVATFRCGLSK